MEKTIIERNFAVKITPLLHHPILSLPLYPAPVTALVPENKKSSLSRKEEPVCRTSEGW
jgi:hypothetical protein